MWYNIDGDIMKNKLLFIGITFTILTLIALALFIFFPRKKVDPEPYKARNEIILMGIYDEILIKKDNYIITNYKDYKNIFNNSELDEESFKSNNYIVIPITYDSCSEEDLKIADYSIRDEFVYVTINYKGKCGLCAPQYMYYLLKVDKKVTNIELKIQYNMINNPHCDTSVTYKPMIYLYPTKKTDVTVELGNPQLLTTTYPKYENKWNVIAKPNGDLIYNNRTYYGLYWEGINNISEDYNDGFVVNKENLPSFLEEKLEILGLNQKETNEFIVYWLPILEKNEYNLIRFESIDIINEQMPLIINPKPDAIIRVLIAYKPLTSKINVKEQQLTKQNRKGFTVVEWGGTLIN